MYTCELCGKVSAEKGYGSGRFCSQSCACKFSSRAQAQKKALAKAAPISNAQSAEVKKEIPSPTPAPIMHQTTIVSISREGIEVQTDIPREVNPPRPSQSLENKFNEVPEVPRHYYLRPQRTRVQMSRLNDCDRREQMRAIEDRFFISVIQSRSDDEIEQLIDKLFGGNDVRK